MKHPKNTEEKREWLRSMAIEAHPEIVELKFGCYVQLEDERVVVAVRPGGYKVGGSKSWWFNNGQTYEKGMFKKVIGRPVRLADILLVIASHTSGLDYFVDPVGRLWKIIEPPQGESKFDILGRWNILMDDLWQQPEAIIDVLYDLISPQK